MRFALFAAAAGLAAACAPTESERCDVEVMHELAFTSDAEPDVVTARALGPACDKTTLLYVISDPEQRPIWAWASPLPRAFGDDFTAARPEQMRAFLERWAQPEVSRTGQAPHWRSLEPGQSTLDQFTYEDIRARDLPMLCHYSGTAQQTCVFWEPAAGGAGHFYDRDVEESVE